MTGQHRKPRSNIAEALAFLLTTTIEYGVIASTVTATYHEAATGAATDREAKPFSRAFALYEITCFLSHALLTSA